MNSHFLKRTAAAAANPNRVGEVLAWLDTTRVRLAMIALAVVMALSYIWLVNSSATLGFQLSDLENRVFALEDDYHSLEIEQTALQSLDHLTEGSQAMQLVATGPAQFTDTDSTVALVDGE
jgi:cell division protein FtsL